MTYQSFHSSVGMQWDNVNDGKPRAIGHIQIQYKFCKCDFVQYMQWLRTRELYPSPTNQLSSRCVALHVVHVLNTERSHSLQMEQFKSTIQYRINNVKENISAPFAAFPSRNSTHHKSLTSKLATGAPAGRLEGRMAQHYTCTIHAIRGVTL